MTTPTSLARRSELSVAALAAASAIGPWLIMSDDAPKIFEIKQDVR